MRGLIVIAALVLTAAAWLYAERPRAVRAAVTPGAPAQAAEASSRFRAAAWWMPDDEMLGFVEIPAGPFRMGSDPAVDPQSFDNEWVPSGTEATTIDLPTFFIGRYEVTSAQYRAFIEASAHRVVDELALRGPADHPVVAVAWTDAVAYARWMDRTLRASPQTPPAVASLLADGYRVVLPSEAEWEKAARGTDGRIYPWGNQPHRDRAIFLGGAPAPVGSVACPECAFGLSDMSGNVWEWTRSPFQPYPYDASDDAGDLEADALWVMRGGSFQEPARYVRAANRGAADPGARRPFIGFRVALSRE